jgi:hypothetical protein
MTYKRVGSTMVVDDRVGDDGRWHYPCIYCEGDIAFDKDPSEPGKVFVAFHPKCIERALAAGKKAGVR